MMQTDPGARLSVSITDGMTVEVRLGLKEIRIGRGHEADLQLPDRSVSRLHARIYRVGNRYFLADLGSRNGTHANGKPVTQLPLDDGQTFQVGPYRIHFLWPEGPSSSGEEPTVAPGPAPVRHPRPLPPRRLLPQSSPRRARVLAPVVEPPPFGMVGGSPPMRKLVETVRRVGPSDAAVLIEGETGSGKELVARGLARRLRPARPPVHRRQLRRDLPGADRKRAVRPRAGRLHRGDRAAQGRLRAGPQRNHFPR